MQSNPNVIAVIAGYCNAWKIQIFRTLMCRNLTISDLFLNEYGKDMTKLSLSTDNLFEMVN